MLPPLPSVAHALDAFLRECILLNDIRNDLFEQLPHLTGDLAELRVFDRAHRRHGIDGGNFYYASVVLLHNYIAGQHRSDLVFRRTR